VIRRIAPSLYILVAGVVAVAFIDLSAPNGATSISSLILPSPSVVVRDSMRDSLGKAAPLRIIAYDANDVPIADAEAQFFVTDSAPVARIDKGVVIGEKQGTIHVVGQVGGVQAVPVIVPITVAPTKLAPTGKIDTLFVPLVSQTDTTAASVGSATLSVSLLGAGDTASIGFVVKYELIKAPATIASPIPGIFLSGDGTKVSPVDTTDGSGASRRLMVRSWLLSDQALRGGQKVDSAVVLVSTSYKGAPVPGSPIRLVIPIKGKIAP
jgi:hypothetical protein